jgi:hypothetical protein
VTAQNILLLVWAVVPPIGVLVGAWFFLRAGRRHDERSSDR